jgi:diguanylate cyclase/two-component system sensory protein
VKNFSLLECALRTSAVGEGKPLQITSLRRRDFNGRESFCCYTTNASVEYACLMIEHALLLKPTRGGRVYAGFEKLSSLRPIIDRYLRIADLSDVVYLFGEDDWNPRRHPNIRVVGLSPDFRLAGESFLITQSPTNQAAFVARNETAGAPNGAPQWAYRAFKSTNPKLVSELAEAMEGVIDWSLAHDVLHWQTATSY